MTSNLGSQLIRENFEHLTDANRNEIIEKTKTQVFELLKQSIRPEFLNRIDELIMFTPLSESEIRQIVGLQVEGIAKMLKNNGIDFSLTDKAIDYVSQEGYDPQFGARPIKRALQRLVLDRLSLEIIGQKIDKDKPIVVDFDGKSLVFKN